MTSLEVRVGRTAVVDRIFAKNGYGNVQPVFRHDIHNLLFFIGKTEQTVPVAGYAPTKDIRLNKEMG